MNTASSAVRLPAKLVRPHVGHAVARTRLFRLIESQTAPGLWIHGPPGNGKTTLVASYVEQRRGSPIWFQVDADDREPSTFFFYLTQALRAHLPPEHKIPVADTERRDDWPGFARRFFRNVLTGLAGDAILVFENIHEMGGVLDDALAQLAAEVAGGQRIIFTSHQPPPAAFVGLLAARHLAEIDAQALRFDMAETSALVVGVTGRVATPAALERLQHATEGWAAGIVLLGAQTFAPEPEDDAAAGAETRLFEYFSRTVIAKLPDPTRSLLEACAFFPDFDGDLAVAASGNAAAADLLDQLHRSRLFIEKRHTDKGMVYRCHGLLAQALRDRVGLPHTVARRRALAAAGKLLVANARLEPSIALLIGGDAADDAASNLVKIAEAMIAEGRLEQFIRLATLLPADSRRREPWVDYYCGLCLSAQNALTAQRVFSQTYERFDAAGDALGCTLCAAAIVLDIETNWHSYEGLERWCKLLDRHWSPKLVFSTPESELRAFAGLIAARFGATPTNEERTDIPSRAVLLIQAAADTNAQVSAATMMIHWFMNARDPTRALYFENFIEREVRIDRASPNMSATWYWILSMLNASAARILRRPELAERSRAYRLTAATIVEAHALTTMKVSLAHAEAARCVVSRDILGIREALDAVESAVQPNQPRLMVAHLYRRTQLHLLSAAPNEAWAAICHLIDLGRSAHYPEKHLSGYYDLAASVLLHLNRFDDALEYNARSLQGVMAGHRQNFEVNSKFIRTVSALHTSEDAALPLLADFFGTLREHRLLDFGRDVARPLAHTSAHALRHKIESAFVYELVVQRNFPPPANADENWPWPLKICALGTFTVTIGGKPLAFDGKAQKKPLEMLQLVVAHQDSATAIGPKVQWLIDELWSNAEAKDPQGAFDTTLHRLRKLIGIDGAIILADGRLSFNTALTWCDVNAFETLAGSHHPLQQTRALAYYSGALLHATSYVWAAAPRERLAVLYIATVEACAGRSEASGDHRAALGWYARALEQDNLVEAFYRGLMRCHLALGDPSEALRSYRRLKELLSIVLGTTPTAETETLRARVAG